MKIKFRITALAALLFIVTITVSNAQYARVNNRMSYSGQCMDIPGLTDVQMEKIAAINDAHQKTIDNMREDFYAAGDVIAANNIKAKMALEQNNHLQKISELLNEEQLKYFNENVIAVAAGGRGRAVNRSGYTNAQGNGRGPCGRGYGRGYGRGAGRGMGYRNFNGRW